MRILRVSLLLLLINFIAPLADAQSPFKGGMNYIAVRAIPAINTNAAKLASIEPAAGRSRRAQAQNTPENKVWTKYRALAAGTQTQSNQIQITNPQAAKPKTISNTQPKTMVDTPPPGIAGILAQYQKRKAKRSQMRSISVK